MDKNKAVLTQGKVSDAILRIAVPMIFGMLSLVIFNLVDTYYVGKLGSNEVAALTFTFPVVLIIGSLSMGIGSGSSAVLSKAVGEGNHQKVQRIVTDSLSLSLLLVLIVAITGMLTIEPVFKMLGARGEVLELVKEYMSIWYIGTIFLIVPQVGNNNIRALGDAKTPSLIMLVAAVTNMVLDPIMIFGFAFVPAMGIKGAAIATVIARATTLAVSIYVLSHREKLINIKGIKPKQVINSWKQIMYIGIPNALTKMIIPLGLGIITNLLASFGTATVAGYGIASRIEYFALILLTALATAVGPFVGQNLGAKRTDRVNEGVKYSYKVSLTVGVVIFVLLQLIIAPVATIFNKDPEVVAVVVRYIRIVSVSYGFFGVLNISTSVMNVMRKPIEASLLALFQTFIIYLPLAKLGMKHYGSTGIFGALMISYFVSGGIAFAIVKKLVSKLDKEENEKTREAEITLNEKIV